MGLVFAAWMVAGVVLHSPVLRLLPARASSFGGETVLGLGYCDHYAVLQSKPGQPSEFRSRWEPTPGTAWLHESDRFVLVGVTASDLGARSGETLRGLHRSRMCCWLL